MRGATVERVAAVADMQSSNEIMVQEQKAQVGTRGLCLAKSDILPCRPGMIWTDYWRTRSPQTVKS